MTFEWGVVAAILGVAGPIAGGWGWLLTLPLLLTWAMCIGGALAAPIDPRFSGLKARALVAALIYLGPFWRGYERLKWRLKAMRAGDPPGLAPVERRPARDWRRRAFALSYWNESGAEKEAILGRLIAFLQRHRHPVVIDTGWEDWDLEIGGDPCSRARILVCAENHGGDKRLLRARATLLLSDPARLGIWFIAAALAVSLVAGQPIIAAAVAALGLAAAAGCTWRGLRFARLVQRMIEAAARDAGLKPLDPIA